MAHEHVIHCPRGLFAPDNEWALRDFNIQLQMVKDYKAIGGGCLVDAMCRDQDGRCPAYLKVISETTGVHIIAATGIPFDYPGDREPLMDLSIVWKDKDVDEIAAGYVKEITEGMNGTNIKAGWIKAGTQYCYATPGEIKGLKAAARAALATGAAVHTHTDGGSFALEQLEIVLNEGLPGSQFGVAHIDRNPDFWLHKKIAESGAYLIYDGPRGPAAPPGRGWFRKSDHAQQRYGQEEPPPELWLWPGLGLYQTEVYPPPAGRRLLRGSRP